MYTGERDLTEVIRSTAPPSFYYHAMDKRTKKSNGGYDATDVLLSALCALAVDIVHNLGDTPMIQRL